jgi:AraC family transcriptional regulator
VLFNKKYEVEKMIVERSETELFIKNMVCPRCIKAVREGLESLGYELLAINLGFAKVKGLINKDKVAEMLLANGFELLDDKDQKLIENIKTKIISLVQSKEPVLQFNLSEWLSKQLDLDYHQMSILFSSAENITIERYFILQRLEKVKELLVYNELSLKEIAFQLGFSSVAHLSAQFKKTTGFTTTHFREIGLNKRKSLDNLIQSS